MIESLNQWAITHDVQRTARFYAVVPEFDGKLLHDLRETLPSGKLPQPDDHNVIEVLSRHFEIDEEAEIEVVDP
jgi:hypothetical protein